MKKNLVLVSSVAGIVLLTGAITFASTDSLSGTTGIKGNRMMQDRLGSGAKFGGMHRGEGMGEGMMFGPEMGDFGGKGNGIGSGMGLLLNQQKQAMQTAIEAAITKGDYTAYTAAVKGTEMEGKVTAIQFKDMVVKHTQRTAMRDAVTKNDYTAFLAAVKGTDMEGKVTQEQFATMVEHQKEMGQRTSTTK